MPGNLLYPMLSLPNEVTPQPLEPHEYEFYFGKASSLSGVGQLGGKGSPGISKLSSNS